MFNTSDVIKIVAIALSTIILTVSAIKAVAGEEHDQGTSAGAAADLTEQDIVTALESRIPGAAAFLLAHGHDICRAPARMRSPGMSHGVRGLTCKGIW